MPISQTEAGAYVCCLVTHAEPRSTTVAVIGAGPYGLSVGAHLRALGAATVVLGEPLESWRMMPARMRLKSVWTASSLADPRRSFDLDSYTRLTGVAPVEPIPLNYFLEYAFWFQRQAVPDIDQVRLECVTRSGPNFRLQLADGRELTAGRVVLAVGVRQFAYVPPFARDLPSDLASHTGDHVDLSGFKGRRVAVVGAGQSALESAAILHAEGADVELIARGPVVWIKRSLYRRGGVVSRLLYPPSDVGPPPLNWLCAAPLLMRKLPPGARGRIGRRAVRPAGANWLRDRFVATVRCTTDTHVVSANRVGDAVRLLLSDGSVREVDHLMVGTGYRPDVARLEIIHPSVAAEIDVANGFPVLNKWFESTVPGLHFVGGLAGYTFGPICRFVAGARIAAQQVAQRAAEA